MESSHERFDIPGEYIGVIYLTENDDVVYLGGKSGIAKFSISSRSFEYKWLYPNGSKLRSNDGNVDPEGNIWQGVMGSFEYGPIDEGCLLKINTTTDEISTPVPNVLISNGINWSKDGKTVYWINSLDFTMYKFDYSKGKITNKRAFISMTEHYPELESPEPDGFTMTESGDLFVAVWSSGSVAHFNSQGELLNKFIIPAQRVSACGFGGANLDELFITTANLKLDEVSKLDENPEDFGGAIFRIKVPGQRGLMRPKLSI